MIRERLFESVFALIVLSCPSAFAGDPTIDTVGQSFVSNLPSTWVATHGKWEYFNAQSCFKEGTTCFGDNPSSPYGYPKLPDANGHMSPIIQLNPNDAVVIILRTPPPMAYFGFTQYLFKAPGQTFPIFASLSDTLNNMEIGTTGSPTPGQNVFDQYSILVWTANVNTLKDVKATLYKQFGTVGNGAVVNFIPLPVNMGTVNGITLPPLQMGVGSGADSFQLLMRTAYPAVPANWDSYMHDAPFYVVKVSPPPGYSLSPAPTTGYAGEVTGILESNGQQSLQDLQAAQTNLVSDIKANFSQQYSFVDQTIRFTTGFYGWTCIATGLPCNGDTHDSLYSSDSTSNVQFVNTNDVLLIVGTNHAATNKGLYVSHSVMDISNQSGIVSFGNTDLTPQSALYWAGITDPSDPRVQQYQSLYAYAISYDCTGLQYCLAIPAPTSSNPIGLQPGTPFSVIGRIYVDPVRLTAPLTTFVRPSLQEIVPHASMIGTHQ